MSLAFTTLAATLLLAASVANAETPAKARAAKLSLTETRVVTIENMRFMPAELTVQRGSRIKWVNRDLFPHTATAESRAFDSGSIDVNASWTYVASRPGEYTYICAFHPTMKGKLIVR